MINKKYTFNYLKSIKTTNLLHFKSLKCNTVNFSKKKQLITFFYKKFFTYQKNFIKFFKIEKTFIINLFSTFYFLFYKSQLKDFEIYNHYKKNEILEIFNYLKLNKKYQLTQLTDITVYDTPGKINRFSLIYSLNSIHYNTRFHTFIKTNEVTPLPSLINIFKASY